MFSSYFRAIFLAPFLGLLSCSQQMESKGSISFTLPESLQEKVDAASTGNLKACFGVGVQGPEISTVTPSSCEQSYGLFSGIVKLGEPISLEVPYGSDRRIRIYYVLSETGCQSFDIKNGLGKTFGSDRVFIISELGKIEVKEPDMSLEMNIQWPSTQNSLATLFSVPESCRKGMPSLNASLPQARVVSGSAKGTTSNGSEIQVRIYNQRLQIKPPSLNETQIGSSFLGETQ